MNTTIEQRLAKLRQRLDADAIDTFMVHIAENRRYLSGFTGEDGQFDETAGMLFITEDRLILATDSRYDLQAAKEALDYEIICYQKGMIKEIPTILEKLKTRKLGFEGTRISFSQYKEITDEIGNRGLDIDVVNLKDTVENLRIVKADSEIQATREALILAENAFRKVAATVRPGMTERFIAWAMEKEMREAGADALSFPTIVAAGPNSALPHAIPGDRMVKEGEPILFDWGARLHGYCSDTSRTIILGEAEKTFKKVHRTVLDAQKYAIDTIRAGANSKAVDAVARDHIDKAGFGGKFGHGLGHGTGLAIHEAPRLSPLTETILEPGMLVTVEPGIYLPGWGGVRIEHQVVVREEGAEILNSANTSYRVDDL